MTKGQKKRTRELLRMYGAAQRGQGQMGEAAQAAVGAAVEAIRADDELKYQLLRLRYLEGKSARAVIGALYLGETTYHKIDLEVLSTAAVVLAERGCILSAQNGTK